jgi:MOSC domain-containing protein YiiM
MNAGLEKTAGPKPELLHLYLSPGHNYFGHHGQPPGQHAIVEVRELRCLAGRGIEGDRFLDHRPDFKGQITFFADEVYQDLCGQFGILHLPPSVFRRNVITRGVDLARWIGAEFAVGDVRFFGTEECRPCGWMEEAFCPGAEAALRGRGGLRARILSDGILRVSGGQ